MRTFISYSHESGDKKFARWLYEELKSPVYGLEPVIDYKDLALGVPWRESLPVLVGTCEFLLFVRSRFSISAPYCRLEMEVADHYGLLVAIIGIDSDTPPDAYADRYSTVDFTQGRQLGLTALRERVDFLSTPAGRAQEESYRKLRATDRKLRKRKGGTRSSVSPTAKLAIGNGQSQIHGHDRPRRDLRGLLSREDAGVIVVSGPEGIGKSALVRHELAGLTGKRHPVIHYHLARPGKVLAVEALESVVMDPERAREQHETRRQLRVPDMDELLDQVERLGDIILAIDSFENLIDRSEIGGLLDLELDEALERVSRRARHNLKVVLITRDLPRPRYRSSWLLTAQHIRVDHGLDPTNFGLLLKDLDRRSDLVPPSTPSSVIDDACHLMHGRPRLAEFVFARASRTFETIHDVNQELRVTDPAVAADFIFQEFVTALDGPARTVLEVLAALGTPVDEAIIRETLDEVKRSIERRRLKNILRWLVSRNAVSTAAGLFYLQDLDRMRVLGCMPFDDHDTPDGRRPGQRTLLGAAVWVLWARHPEDPQSADEFDYSIAAINALIADEQYKDAAERLHLIDQHLIRWRRSSLLLQQRLRIRRRIQDDYLEFVNETAIGLIYLENGLYGEALTTLHSVRALAGAFGSEGPIAGVLINLGSAYMRVGQTEDAYGSYVRALDEAEQRHCPAEQALALEGIANCHRRWGEFDEAYETLDRALGIAADDTFFGLHLRLARWYAMDGDPRAHEHLRETEKRRSGDRSDAAYFDQVADQALVDGDVEMAIFRATKAERIAQRTGDRVLLQRVRTTLAFATLLSDEWAEARRWAKLAGRDRPGGRNLLILSLRALTAEHDGDHASARADFGLLRDEAFARMSQDPRDYTASGFHGFALCGRHVCSSEPLEPAVVSLRRYAQPTAGGDVPRRLRTPAQYTVRLRALLTSLGSCASNKSLAPALQVLDPDA